MKRTKLVLHTAWGKRGQGCEERKKNNQNTRFVRHWRWLMMLSFPQFVYMTWFSLSLFFPSMLPFLTFSFFLFLLHAIHTKFYASLFLLYFSSAWSALQKNGPSLTRTPTKHDGKAGFWIPMVQVLLVLGKSRPWRPQRLEGHFLPQPVCSHKVKY